MHSKIQKRLLMWIRTFQYFQRVGSAISQLINVALLFGDRPNESVSGRAYRMARGGARRWLRVESLLNLIFRLVVNEEDHCYKAYLTDVTEARLLVKEHTISSYPYLP